MSEEINYPKNLKDDGDLDDELLDPDLEDEILPEEDADEFDFEEDDEK